VVFKRGRSEAARRERDGLVSHILLHAGDLPEARLSVTWVDIGPGSLGKACTATLRSRSTSSLGDGEDQGRRRGAGDLIYIPPDTLHSIENPSDEVLTYIAAATTAVDWEAFYDTGPLQAELERERERTDER
jgi:hypothetical protein